MKSASLILRNIPNSHKSMQYRYSIQERLFHFKQPATTSRGVYNTRLSYFVRFESLSSPGVCGIGECAFLPDLSCDDVPDYRDILEEVCFNVSDTGVIDYDRYRQYPSILFGIETALVQIETGGSMDFFDTPFAKGLEGIPINGLIWIGTYEEMMGRIEEKIEAGYRCIKLKVGAIDFDKELALLRHIRSISGINELEIRLDANGGLSPEKALACLEEFSGYGIHSIEQPIKQGQLSAMRELCKTSPIPIALDEELIGVNETDGKKRLLDIVRPAYIILKPSLHGGMRGVEEWVRLAEERHIGSWITSALESNIGLNAIAQLAARIYGPGIKLPQGLGTGCLFSDNVSSPLELKNKEIWLSAK